MLRRLHLFEFEDLPQCPAVVRAGLTAYLTWFARTTKLFDSVADHVEGLVGTHSTVVDLCTGAGGPAEEVVRVLAERGHQVQVVCTDLYPDTRALTSLADRLPQITVHPEPVDATQVPATLSGPRLLFNALHHFRPPQARAILEDAVRKGQPIGAFEFVGRQAIAIPGMLGVPLAFALTLPFYRPFRWAWVPLTYLVPVLPLLGFWDGSVSCLRVYSPDELRELVQGLDSFSWDIGHFDLPFPGVGTYLVGVPRVD